MGSLLVLDGLLEAHGLDGAGVRTSWILPNSPRGGHDSQC